MTGNIQQKICVLHVTALSSVNDNDYGGAKWAMKMDGRGKVSQSRFSSKFVMTKIV